MRRLKSAAPQLITSSRCRGSMTLRCRVQSGRSSMRLSATFSNFHGLVLRIDGAASALCIKRLMSKELSGLFMTPPGFNRPCIITVYAAQRVTARFVGPLSQVI